MEFDVKNSIKIIFKRTASGQNWFQVKFYLLPRSVLNIGNSV